MKPRQPAARHLSVLRDVPMQPQPHALEIPRRSHASTRSTPATHSGLGVVVPPTRRCEHECTDALREAYAAGHEAGMHKAAEAHRTSLEESLWREREAARLAGHAEGMEQAKKRMEEALLVAEQSAASHRDRLEQLLANAESRVHERLQGAEEDMVALCHAVVCQVLGDTAATEAGLRAMLRHHLNLHALDTQALTVHVHPGDHALLTEASLSDAGSTLWVADAGVELGGMVLRSPRRSLDARLEVQLTELRRVLVDTRRQRAAREG